MNSIENDVFTACATALRTEFGTGKIFVTGEYTPTPPLFPCCFITEEDNFANAMNGSNEEVITAVMYQVEAFSNKHDGKKSECKKILDCVDSVLTPLGFKRTFRQPLPNMQDASIYRMTARYTAAVIDNTIYRR